MKIKKLLSLILAGCTAFSTFAMIGFVGNPVSAADSQTGLIAGDANGDLTVNTEDLILIRKYLANMNYETGESSEKIESSADMDGNGTVNLQDVILMRQYLVEKGDFDTVTNTYGKTISLADKLVGAVNASYSDDRNMAHFSNGHLSFDYPLQSLAVGDGAIKSPNGNVYVNAVSEPYIKDTAGNVFFASEGGAKERMNVYRLGSYYYEVHMLDGRFTNNTIVNEKSIDLSTFTRGNSVSNITYSNGKLGFTVSSDNDPHIYGNSFSVAAEDYNAVLITLTTSVSNSARFYMVAGSKTGFNGEQTLAFNVIPDGQPHTYIVDISSLPDYTGNVKNIRVDIGSEAGEQVEISSLKMVKTLATAPDVALDMTYHLYSDKLNEVVRVVARDEVANLGAVGVQTRISADSVEMLIVKDKNGSHTSLEGIDWQSTEFVGFDIVDAGIYGHILLPHETSGIMTVTLEDGIYTITQEYTLSEGETLAQYGSVKVGRRIYTDETHSFDGFVAAAEDERQPLTEVSVNGNVHGAKYVGYDALRGAYVFDVNGTGFQTAYDNPELRFIINATFGGAEEDRSVYVVSHTTSGQLEYGVLMSSDGLLLPVDVEVCKNFGHEEEEPLYDNGDTTYGEAIFPYVVESDRENAFTIVNLYQNWGNFPLKQISSIQFIAPYYHISVGTTETNCIAPYYVYGKDRWTLPDFRAMSAPMWASQPQHTSIGRLYFLEYTTSDGEFVASESIDNIIDSCGPTYCDIDMNYLSDDGKIKAYYRHMEMPHTDENRTYYELVLEVTEDIEITDFKNDFAFFSFDGRFNYYNKLGYLNENNECVITDASTVSEPRYITLGDNSPYVSFFEGPETTNMIDYVNFGLVVKDYSFIVGGESYDGNLVIRELKQDDLNRMSLTLDLGNVTLKAGDKLSINMILLPWGDPSAENDDNVRAVRQDSCIDPYKIEASVGEVIDDEYMPKIMSDGGMAEFTLSGGTNNCVVRAYGFNRLTVPKVLELVGGEWVEYKLSSDEYEYDGYTVYYDGNGYYSYAFVVNMTDADERIFRVTATEGFTSLEDGWQYEQIGVDLPLNVYITPENDEMVSGEFTVCGLTYEKAEDNSYYRFYGDGTRTEGYVFPVNKTYRFMTTGQYVVFKYRAPESFSGVSTHFDIFSGTESSSPVGDGSDSFRLRNVVADGEWHVLVVDMSSLSGFNADEFGAYLADYIRFDLINSSTAISADQYIDVAYFGMSDSLEDICALNSDMDSLIFYQNGKTVSLNPAMCEVTD